MKTGHTGRSGRRPWAAALAIALAASPVLIGLSALPAEAAPRISVVSSQGNAKASAAGPTSVTVTGSGLQSIPKAFGGVYVTFGYVKNTGGWRPSQGGKSGRDYFYVSDSQARNNQGYQRFVAFPGSSTSDSANGGTLSASGAFKLKMVIPGPTFSAETATGGRTTIDCRNVQCGIFTFGAHGVANGNNESFTPISFGAAATSPGSASQGSDSAANGKGTSGNATQSPATQAPGTGSAITGTETPTAQDQTAGAVPRAVTSGNPALGIEQKTVVAGRALAFTGQGFAPGEQVVGTMASGTTAAGPITAGTFGEVAGAVQIPADMVPGTHKLKLTGAGSGTNVEAEFSVMADPATLANPAVGSSDGVRWALIAVIVAGSLLFLVILVSLVTAFARRNKNPKSRPKGKKKRRPASRGRGVSAPKVRATGSAGAVRPAASVPHETSNNHSPAAAAPEPVTNAIELLPEHFSKETV
ncbi:hypothetical protein ACFY5D_14580 [Paeniglutamicibacter sp. NPDC012692]|uniref:hypothetical protein n=1 Tax=Paeniglutamicibacter sp. NPDC012692 TaxID=3364388 RepID=UPI00368C0149